MFISDLKVVFLIDEGVVFHLEGVGINCLISSGLILFSVVELTNKVESLLPITSSLTTVLSSDSLISTINSFKISCMLVLVKGLPLQEEGLIFLQLKS